MCAIGFAFQSEQDLKNHLINMRIGLSQLALLCLATRSSSCCKRIGMVLPPRRKRKKDLAGHGSFLAGVQGAVVYDQWHRKTGETVRYGGGAT